MIPRCPCWTPFVGALALVLLLSGCRSAPVASPGDAPPTPALTAPAELTRNTIPAELARPGASHWVRTKTTYDRPGLSRHAWTATQAAGGAAPAGGAGAGAGGGSGDLAAQSQNPISSLISLPFQNNTSFGIGPYDRTLNVLNIQPVIPISIGKWSLVNRTIIPIITQPELKSATQSWTGLGDLNHTTFIVPPAFGDIMIGAGPVILFPTATDENLGRRQWGLGPSAVVVATKGKFVMGALVNNIWSLGRVGTLNPDIEGQVQEVNQFLAQYFVNYNLPQGWYLVSAPIITADWNRPADDRWVVPFGGGLGKVFKIGKQPVNAGIQGYYNAIRPDGSAPWTLRVQLTFLFPKG